MATKSAAHFIDSGISGNTITAIDISGAQKRYAWYPANLAHLNTETVQVLGDGAYLGTETVASGGVALDDNTTTNHVGLKYTSTVKPTKLDIEGLGLAIKKRITKAIISFYNTLGGKFGADTDSMDTITFRTAGDSMDDSPALFSGTKEVSFAGGYDRDGDIIIQQEQPLPLLCRGITLKLDAYDDE